MENLLNFYSQIERETSIKVSSLEEVSNLLLTHKDTSIRSSICFLVAENKIKSLQKVVIQLLCSNISKGNDSTLIYTSYQFECSQYFNMYIALILEREYHSCLECYGALKKCRKVSIKDLIYAKEALEGWYYFHNIDEFKDEVVSSKKEVVYQIWEYLKNRIKRESKKV